MDQNILAQNMAGSGTGDTFSSAFGNLNFQIIPSETGEVNMSFGTIPYLALESIIESQAGSGGIDPTRINSGMSQGNSIIQGQTSIQDSNGLTRMVMGYVPGGF